MHPGPGPLAWQSDAGIYLITQCDLSVSSVMRAVVRAFFYLELRNVWPQRCHCCHCRQPSGLRTCPGVYGPVPGGNVRQSIVLLYMTVIMRRPGNATHLAAAGPGASKTTKKEKQWSLSKGTAYTMTAQAVAPLKLPSPHQS